MNPWRFYPSTAHRSSIMRTVESLLTNAVKSVASAILLEHATIAAKPVSNQPHEHRDGGRVEEGYLEPFLIWPASAD